LNRHALAQIGTKMSITIPLKTLLELLDHAMQPVEPGKKERITVDFVNLLDSQCDMDRQQAFKILVEMKRPKVIVASRTVPVSHPEEMGSNGLMWRDVRGHHLHLGHAGQ
jgi:hypothetical protein